VTHLDTSFLIAALEGRPRELAWMDAAAAGAAPLAISAIAWCEFLCGPLRPGQERDARALLGEPVAFTEADAALAATLYNQGGRRRGSLPDCQIAAVAIRSGAGLATPNPRDFARFTAAGLRLATEAHPGRADP